MDQTLPPTVKLDGEKVKQIRESRGLTQLYVATVVGVTTDTISRWENKRYPSIKRENALKLAETLEVDIEQILEDVKEEDAGEPPRSDSQGQNGGSGTREEDVSRSPAQEETEQNHEVQGSKGNKKTKILLNIAIWIFCIGCGLLAGYFLFRPSLSPINIQARRLLPFQCARGKVFPVVIEVQITPKGTRTILVKEDLPRSVKIVKAMPAYTSLKKNLLKWIAQDRETNVKFVYLAKINKSVKEYKLLRFKGTVTIKAEQTVSVSVGGNDELRVAPFHWADQNADYTIDDQEILDAYDLLSGVKGVQQLLKEVEFLWAAGNYTWDPKKMTFLPAKSTER